MVTDSKKSMRSAPLTQETHVGKLLTIAGDPKTVKGERRGYRTAILYLAPVALSGKNVCSHASRQCAQACLFTAGRGRMLKARQARIRRTKLFWSDPKTFMRQLYRELGWHVSRARKRNMKPCTRLNGTSDIAWEHFRPTGQTIMAAYPEIQFYDYTKNPARMRAYLDGRLPKNYALMFSRSETNDKDVREILAKGGNVSVVFRVRRKQPLPNTWMGAKVLDGDRDDLRFLDPQGGYVIGLRAKGKAWQQESGFVIDLEAAHAKAA